ncbi:MAG: transketolase [Candidatus Omnitrophica bacterium]|nr:transketolase [Candidatus Omnitrophota bacterium]
MIPECKRIRENILKISNKSGHGHIPTCFSVVEVLYALYSIIKCDPKDPLYKNRDIFVLSKGHAALALYCILAQFGYFDIKKVYSLGSFMSDFGCHADRFKVPGIEVSTGSLGHGIGVATGMALALRIQKSQRHVYTLIGDGEANEGAVWEAIMVASDLRLSNLTVIYDNNRSHPRGLQIQKPVEIFKGFGCDVAEVPGHDIAVLQQEFKKRADTVRVVVANSKKGFGCKTFIDNQYEWHRKSPTDNELEILMRELDEKAV